MEVLSKALKEQYHAGLAMLVDCVRKCPDDLWTAPAASVPEPDRPFHRSFWRIAFHTVYFSHLYLDQTVDDFQPWPGRRPGYFEGMWQKPWDVEPFEFPEDAEPASKDEVLAYIEFVDGLIDPTIDHLDLDRQETGIPWYTNMTKLSHELLNLRHLQGHVGQLSELLMMRGIDSKWISKSTSASC